MNLNEMPPRLARSSFTDGYFCELRVQVIVVIVLVSKQNYYNTNIVDPSQSHQLLSNKQIVSVLGLLENHCKT